MQAGQLQGRRVGVADHAPAEEAVLGGCRPSAVLVHGVAAAAVLLATASAPRSAARSAGPGGCVLGGSQLLPDGAVRAGTVLGGRRRGSQETGSRGCAVRGSPRHRGPGKRCWGEAGRGEARGEAAHCAGSAPGRGRSRSCETGGSQGLPAAELGGGCWGGWASGAAPRLASASILQRGNGQRGRHGAPRESRGAGPGGERREGRAREGRGRPGNPRSESPRRRGRGKGRLSGGRPRRQQPPRSVTRSGRARRPQPAARAGKGAAGLSPASQGRPWRPRPPPPARQPPPARGRAALPQQQKRPPPPRGKPETLLLQLPPPAASPHRGPPAASHGGAGAEAARVRVAPRAAAGRRERRRRGRLGAVSALNGDGRPKPTHSREGEGSRRARLLPRTRARPRALPGRRFSGGRGSRRAPRARAEPHGSCSSRGRSGLCRARAASQFSLLHAEVVGVRSADCRCRDAMWEVQAPVPRHAA